MPQVGRVGYWEQSTAGYEVVYAGQTQQAGKETLGHTQHEENMLFAFLGLSDRGLQR